MDDLKGENEMLTVQEAAVRAGRSETAIRSAITRGRLPETLLYGRKLIKATDLDAYLNEAKRGRPKRPGPARHSGSEEETSE